MSLCLQLLFLGLAYLLIHVVHAESSQSLSISDDFLPVEDEKDTLSKDNISLLFKDPISLVSRRTGELVHLGESQEKAHPFLLAHLPTLHEHAVIKYYSPTLLLTRMGGCEKLAMELADLLMAMDHESIPICLGVVDMHPILSEKLAMDMESFDNIIDWSEGDMVHIEVDHSRPRPSPQPEEPPNNAASWAVHLTGRTKTTPNFGYGVVMEYADGFAVETLLRRGYRFPRKTLIRVFRDLLAAIHELHTKGVAHGNLNLGNVMLSSKSNLPIKILGWSRFQTNQKPFNFEKNGGMTQDYYDLGLMILSMTYGKIIADPTEYVAHLKKSNGLIHSAILSACLNNDPEIRWKILFEEYAQVAEVFQS